MDSVLNAAARTCQYVTNVSSPVPPVKRFDSAPCFCHGAELLMRSDSRWRCQYRTFCVQGCW